MAEIEQKYDIIPTSETTFLYSKQGRLARKNSDFLENIRQKVPAEHNRINVDDLNRTFSFLPDSHPLGSISTSFVDTPKAMSKNQEALNNQRSRTPPKLAPMANRANSTMLRKMTF